MQSATRTSTACIDNGYFKTKSIINNQCIDFRSQMEEQVGTNLANDAILVEFEGKQYTVGVGKDNINMNKTEELNHKVFTLTALGLGMDYSETFNLILALPMSHFRNNEFRESFKTYMMTPSINQIRVNGKKKLITIKDVTVFMQGAAALYSDPQRYKNKLIGLIDWGGLTINACIFENLNPIMDSMITINAGTLILDNKIKTALNERFFMNVQDYEIPYLLREEQYKSVIEKVIDKHFEEVKREMRAKGWNLDTIEKLGVGGGVLRTKEYIHKHFSRLEIPDEPQYENVKGLQVIGEMIYGL